MAFLIFLQKCSKNYKRNMCLEKSNFIFNIVNLSKMDGQAHKSNIKPVNRIITSD